MAMIMVAVHHQSDEAYSERIRRVGDEKKSTENFIIYLQGIEDVFRIQSNYQLGSTSDVCRSLT